MPTKSLPVGDALSHIALGSEALVDTHHTHRTVMGECAETMTLLHYMHFYCMTHFYTYADELSSDPHSVPSSPSSQSGTPTADKVPSTEMEALTAAQQGMLHAVSLQLNID